MRYNEELMSIPQSRSAVFMAKAKEMQKADPTVISLSVGEPDFATPKRICDEACKWMQAGYTHYLTGDGLPELRERIARKLREENGCAYTADQVLLAPGGKMAIYMIVRALLNRDDEAMYLEPGWVSYPSIITVSGGTPVAVRLRPQNSFALTRDLLEEKITDRTKLLIINYPNNPTGRCLSRAEADMLEEFMLAHPQLLLLSDEMYERILYTGAENISPASYPSIAERVITMNGFSKSVAMTGWRCGYLACSKELRSVIMKLGSHTITCVSGFVQKAALTALDCTEEIEEMRAAYEDRRNAFIPALNAIPGVHCDMPDGAFYAWVKFDLPGMNSEQACEYIMREARVVGVPGSAFYGTDDSYVRFSFASPKEELLEAAARIRTAMEKFGK